MTGTSTNGRGAAVWIVEFAPGIAAGVVGCCCCAAGSAASWGSLRGAGDRPLRRSAVASARDCAELGSAGLLSLGTVPVEGLPRLALRALAWLLERSLLPAPPLPEGGIYP